MTQFGNVLRYGLNGKSTGVMMFTTDAIAIYSSKIIVMKKIYTAIRKKSH
jgi:hypothetical protein